MDTDFKFFELNISEDLGWTMNTIHIIKKPSSSAALLPEKAEEEQTPSTSPEELLSMYNRDYPELRLHSVVLQLHHIVEKTAAVAH